jgi:hypothetical protein
MSFSGGKLTTLLHSTTHARSQEIESKRMSANGSERELIAV